MRSTTAAPTRSASGKGPQRPRARRAVGVLLACALALVSLPLAATPAAAAAANVAGSATVTASSQNAATGQTAAKAVDGSRRGYPADPTKEWATVGGRSGSFLTLTWAQPVTINKVVLYDRPNSADRITGGRLTFSSGAAVNVPSLTNSGAATTVNFATRTVTRLTLTVSSVSSATLNVGLAEIEVWTVDAPVNAAPVANAGADVSVVEGTTVTLDGSGTDANGDALTYLWTAPAGVTLSATNVAKPTFAATTPGTYTFSLAVNDGKVASPADSVTVTVTANRAPVASAGTDQTVARGASVTLNGSGTDADGQPLTYTWSGPSAGLLSATNVARPTFAASTVSGTTYTFTLTVSDGTLSATDSVVVTVAANTPPVANAGADQTVTVNAVVALSGSGTDGDADALTYRWTAPAGVSLSSTTAAAPTFTASTLGSLTFSLVVNDGTSDSPADTVVVTVNQAAPVSKNLATTATATASSQNTSTAQTAAKAIDGSRLGYPADPTKEWATVAGKGGSWIKLTWATPVTIDKVVLFDRPNTNDRITGGQLTFSSGGGAAVSVPSLANAGTATTVTFTPRTVTSVTLTVSSVSATTENVGLAEFEVWGSSTPVNVAPVANAGADQAAVVGSTVTLSGSGTDGNGDALTYAWTPPPGVTLSATDVANPTFTASTVGTYTFSLVVSDGVLSSAVDSVTVSVNANRAPVANAGADLGVAPGAVVTLNGSGTDPDNQPLTYAWTPPAGVTLSATDVAKPSFTAGATPGTTYTLVLTVSDGELSSTDEVIVTVQPLGTLTVATSGTSAVFTAAYEAAYSGKAARLQYLQFATKAGEALENAVATATWKYVTSAAAKSVDSSGRVAFTIANPYEVKHSYRVVVDPGGSAEKLTNEVTFEAPRSTRNTGLATVYIDTNESEAITSRDDYWEGSFTLAAPDGSRCTDVGPTPVKVAGRGNSTWDLDKKPYKFGLYASTDLCGMGKFKKWNLIANFEDDSLIRNSLVMKMGATMSGLEWTPKSTPVDVYVNGDFQGSYTIMDRVTGDKNRIKIDSLKGKDANGVLINTTAPAVTGGYLLEWDNRRTSMNNVFVGSNAVVGYVGEEQSGAYNGRGWVGIKEPEDEDDGTGINAAQLAYIDAYLEEADAAIADGNWQNYIDANSAADYIIAMELTKNYGANMRSSVFMYKKRDTDLTTPGDQGKLFFGPLWDFDTSFGNATHAGPQEATTDGWWVSEPGATSSAIQGTPTWFHDLMDDPAFKQVVTTRFAALEANGFKAEMDSFITSESAFIAQSAQADGDEWGSDGFDGAAGQLKTWFGQRWAWLAANW